MFTPTLTPAIAGIGVIITNARKIINRYSFFMFLSSL